MKNEGKTATINFENKARKSKNEFIIYVTKRVRFDVNIVIVKFQRG